jgi:uncharacterized protein (TIGR01777 family)
VRIVIAGGSGLLGTALTRRLQRDGHTVAVLTRRPSHVTDVGWNPDAPGEPWAGIVGAADAVVNLAGESIAGGRWTRARKAALVDSRIRATRALAAAIAAAPQPPAVFLSGSAIGIYGARGDELVTEQTQPGDDFLAALCVAWEREAMAAAAATRVVLLRTGVVLAREGGALPQMALPFRFFAGGPVGSGRQCVPWIHIDDWAEMVGWALATAAVTGPLNITAPHPVTNRELADTIGRVLGRPALLPAPAFALRLALGEMAGVVLTGACVVPAKAQTLGFTFRYPRLEAALRSLYSRGK